MMLNIMTLLVMKIMVKGDYNEYFADGNEDYLDDDFGF